ncbi:MAG: IS1634 family transposase [Treponema sp.]|jgi:transposase|nr:IS1634 family transposase [Treponema sp.]
MFIDVFKNSGKPYLRLVNSVKVKNAAGKKVSQKRAVLNIGPLDKYDDGMPDYVERLRKSFKAGQPLIDFIEPYCEKHAPLKRYNFHYTDGDPACIGNPKLFSHVLLERILEELGLNYFFSSYKGFTKLQYDVYSFAKMMIFGRLLNPVSKLATVKQNGDYYEPIITDGYNPDNIYDTLDFIASNHDKIIRRMNTNLMKKSDRNTDIIFYDVTNFYYEIEDPDEDETDEDGTVLSQGLRKMGVCKEERKQPIVQMGLFMDSNGLPIAVSCFPGNTLDHLTLKTALSKNIDNTELSRFILIADRGICNYPNIFHVTDNGNGYIMAKSLLKSNAAEREWAYSDDGFICESDTFKYKSRTVRKTVKDEHGQSREITEKVVIYWSENFAKRGLKENESFLELLDRLMETPENFRITAVQAKSLRKFLDKNMVNKNTGEIINSSELRAMIDKSKVEAYTKNFGYYQLVTSELTMGEKEIIEKYHGLSQIENQFRIMKGDLNTRPLFVRNPEHVKAHLLICMIALTVMRIIQNRVVSSGVVPSAGQKGVSWTMGLSGERIQSALNKWQVELLPGDYFKFMNTADPDLKLILDAFGINIPLKFFRRADLKQIKTNIKNFM